MLQVVVSTPGLAGRFAAAAGWEPLSGLRSGDAAELAGLLDGASDLEELPGRWQAALLQAEAARAGRVVAGGGCCGGGAAGSPELHR